MPPHLLHSRWPLAALLSLVVTLVMTWPLAKSLHDALPGHLGDPLLNAWIIGWGAERLAEGFSGFWQAPIFHPHPNTLTYSEHLLGVTVFVAPIYWLTGNPILAYNFAFLACYVLASVGMYLLTFALTGRRIAALVAAMAFGFCPYFTTSQITRLQVLACGWAPLALYGLHRYFESGSLRMLATFVAAYLLLALSNTYFLFYFAVPVALVVGYGLWTHETSRLRLLRGLVVAAAILVVALTPIGRVYHRTQERTDVVRSTAENDAYSAEPHSYLRVWHESPLASWLPPERTADRALFPGFTLLLLALIGLIPLRWRLWPQKAGLPSTSPRPRRPGATNLRPLGKPSCATAWQAAVDDGIEPTPVVQAFRPASGVVGLYAAIAGVCFLLSLGPHPTGSEAPSGLYFWLMQLVPGLDGLRSPARFGVFAILALSVLAGFGAARLLSGRLTPARAALALALVAGLLSEGCNRPLPIADFDAQGRPEDRAAYEWLRTKPGGAVLELPVTPRHFREPPISGMSTTLLYQYATLVHGHPLFNGSSGFTPALATFLEGGASPFRNTLKLADGVQMLRDLGGRFIVVHQLDFKEPPVVQDLLDTLRAEDDQVISEHVFGDTHVFELSSTDPVTPHTLDGSAMSAERVRVTTTHAPHRIQMVVDGDPSSRWLSGGEQNGDELIHIRLDRPTNVSGLRFALQERSHGDYPRRLRIEGRDPANQLHTLYEGSVLTHFALALMRDPTHTEFDIGFDPNNTVELNVRQTGQSTNWNWSIHELEIWERQPLASRYSPIAPSGNTDRP